MVKQQQLEEARRRSRRDAQTVKDLPENFIEMLERKFGYMSVGVEDTGFKAGMAYGRFTVYSELMAMRHMDVGDVDV